MQRPEALVVWGSKRVILASQDVLYASQILTSVSEPHPICPTGLALQIQCYQCEEFQLNNDCSSPEFIVNCTVNVQDMCQKEVMEQSAGKKLFPASPPPLPKAGKGGY